MMNIYINKVEKLSDKEIKLIVRNLEEIYRDLTDEDSKKICEMLIDIVKSEKGLNKEISEYLDNKFICDSYELLGAGEEDKKTENQYSLAQTRMILSGWSIESLVNAIYLLEDITEKNALEGVQSLKYYVRYDEVYEDIEFEGDRKSATIIEFELQAFNVSLYRSYFDVFYVPPTC